MIISRFINLHPTYRTAHLLIYINIYVYHTSKETQLYSKVCGAQNIDQNVEFHIFFIVNTGDVHVFVILASNQ